MRIVSIVGARPQFIKLGPVHEALLAQQHEHFIVHTGQHYDHNMSDVFFADLMIPAPDVDLKVGSASHGAQTGRMLEAIEKVLRAQDSDWVLVYGDTNSTLAGALAAGKLQRRVAHLEAGLRSFNRLMPEELNRVATDHVCDLLLAPTHNASELLAREGLADRTVLTGDVMADVCLRVSRSLEDGDLAPFPGVEPGQPYLLATVHRPANTDDPSRLNDLVRALADIPTTVVLAAHPRLRERARTAGINLHVPGLAVIDPLGYADMIAAMKSSIGIITDSGGLQKEAYILGVPCTTIRQETEWGETLDGGWNIVDDAVRNLALHALRPRPVSLRSPAFGDGTAASHVTAALSARILA